MSKGLKVWKLRICTNCRGCGVHMVAILSEHDRDWLHPQSVTEDLPKPDTTSLFETRKTSAPPVVPALSLSTPIGVSIKPLAG